MKSNKGFTLIELLIVVAIIGILAAIAIPNFLEAQVRAKVARVKSELNTLGTAMELYMVDWNVYPFPTYWERGLWREVPWSTIDGVVELSTPIAYITSVDYIDPFRKKGEWDVADWGSTGAYFYGNFHASSSDLENSSRGGWARMWARDPINFPLDYTAWIAYSFGPDKQHSALGHAVAGAPADNYWPDPRHAIYDPTNGTVSLGDIGRAGGSVPPSVHALGGLGG